MAELLKKGSRREKWFRPPLRNPFVICRTLFLGFDCGCEEREDTHTYTHTQTRNDARTLDNGFYLL
jgi:hypothetical protein